MDDTPVLKSKLVMPELPDNFLLTGRLGSLHESMDCRRAISVCAPAGYGKTTLLVSFFHKKSEPSARICWYRIDPEDKNLSVFLAHLAEALFPSEIPQLRDCGKSLKEQLNQQDKRKSIASLICGEMWKLHSHAVSSRTYIVLDDFQNAAQTPEICDMVRYIMDNLPPSFSIFILSRTAHSIFTERQKLDKGVLEIAVGDLAFGNTEIEELMSIMGKGPKDNRLAKIIEKASEGWIAGIIILYQAFKSMDPGTISIKNGALCQEDALFRYMSLEVIKSISDDNRNAIARLALLQDFSEEEAARILEIDNIKLLLGQCMGFGMFIQRIPGSPVVYRFHSLFREFLLYILKNHYPQEQIATLHLKAAGYYMQHGAYGRAAEHLTNCGNSDLAMDLVTRAGFNKFLIGETGQLKQWLDMLPEDVIMDNPVLLFFKVQLMPNSRQPEMVETLKKIMRMSLQENNLVIYYDAASVLIYILMCSNNMKELLEITKDNPHGLQNTSTQLSASLTMLDMVKYIAEEQYTLAEATSESIIPAMLPEDNQWLYLVLSCIIYFCLGRLNSGEHCMEKALELESVKSIEPSRGFILLFLSMVMTMKNQRKCLPDHIAAVINIGEKYDYEYLSAHGKRLAAFEQYLSCNTVSASEMLELAAFHFLRINNQAMAAACRLLRRLWNISGSVPASDPDEDRRDIALIHKATPGLMVYESSLSIAGAIARELGDFALAEEYLLTSMERSKKAKGCQVLCGSCFHIAKLYFSLGELEKGRLYLKQAVELAAANGYFMFWDIHIPTIVEMALRSIQYGYCSEYTTELLRRFFEEGTVRYLTGRIKNMSENRISPFIDAFTGSFNENRSLHLYYVNAYLFGNVEVSVNGIVIPDNQWKTKKVKGLLEYLLLNSGSTVSKEYLAELFWPGSDSKSGVASQRTALYHLRKILSKYQAQVAGSSAFIYETPEGLQIRRNDALELDIHEFMRLYNGLASCGGNAAEEETRRAELLKRMIELYRGDLLEGSDYSDLILNERERFKSIFIDACKQLSAIYMKKGELVKAEEILRRAAAAEPYNEVVCLEQLRLYMSQGRKSKAVKLYYSFKHRLEQELDIKVDKRLAEAIRDPD